MMSQLESWMCLEGQWPQGLWVPPNGWLDTLMNYKHIQVTLL